VCASTLALGTEENHSPLRARARAGPMVRGGTGCVGRLDNGRYAPFQGRERAPGPPAAAPHAMPGRADRARPGPRQRRRRRENTTPEADADGCRRASPIRSRAPAAPAPGRQPEPGPRRSRRAWTRMRAAAPGRQRQPEPGAAPIAPRLDRQAAAGRRPPPALDSQRPAVLHSRTPPRWTARHHQRSLDK